MEQLSLPYRIALVGILVFGLLYFFVIKGGDEPVGSATPAAATAPGVKGLTTAVEKARSVATGAATTAATTPAAPASAPASKPATPAVATTTSAPATPATPAETVDPSAPILAELAKGRTAVILFSGTTAADDRAVRRAVRRMDRHDGTVRLHIVSIKKVGDYEAITRGVQVLQAPTLLVIGKDRQARKIVGFTTTAEIDQLVDDVRGAGRATARASNAAERRYDAAITKICGTPLDPAALLGGSPDLLKDIVGHVERQAGALAALSVPPGRARFHDQYLTDTRAMAADLAGVLAAASGGGGAQPASAAAQRLVQTASRVSASAVAAGYPACG